MYNIFMIAVHLPLAHYGKGAVNTMLQPERIPYKWRALGTVAVGALMTTVDSRIVNAVER